MKSLQFKNIRYKNLMSVGNVFMEVSLDDYKTTLITGKNGSAKSTILEAIFYSLFDTPFRKVKLGQLINSTNNKNLVVELELNNGSDHVIIKRGQKPSIFEIIVNNEPWNQEGSKKDTQERLEKYLGINSVSFRQVVVLGTAGYKPFMELTTPERRKLVDDILDLSAIAQMDRLNKEQIRTVNQDLGLSTVKITALEDKKLSLEKINEIQKQKLKEANTRIQLQIDSLVEQEQNLLNTIKIKKEEYVNLDVIDFDLGLFKTNRDKIKDAISTLTYKIKDLTKKIILHQLGKCPECEGELDKTHAKDLQPQVDKNNEIKDKLNAALLKLESSYNTYIKETSILDKAKADLLTLSQKYKELTTQINYLNASFKSMPESVDTSEDITKCDNDLVLLTEEKIELTGEKYIRSILTDLLKDSGIKSKVVQYYIPYLNQRINYYLGLLDADYNFTLDSEFNEQIKSIGRENFSYHSFSQGEKARIDISMLFSWRDVSAKISGTNINLLLLDEIFDGPSDSDAKNNIMNILRSIDANIYVISHADHDPQDYSRHIKMTKVGRFSQQEVNEN